MLSLGLILTGLVVYTVILSCGFANLNSTY